MRRTLLLTQVLWPGVVIIMISDMEFLNHMKTGNPILNFSENIIQDTVGVIYYVIEKERKENISH